MFKTKLIASKNITYNKLNYVALNCRHLYQTKWSIL